nr:MAG TPA: hypothetical protein [Caudoviricetes sp.]
MFVIIYSQGLGTAYSIYITTHSLHDFFHSYVVPNLVIIIKCK